MSIRLMTRVWADDELKRRADLLVMLAIADFANDTGTAWPSIDTLAKKSRCTDRAVQKVVTGLIRSRKLMVERGKGPHGTNLYRVIAYGVNSVHPELKGSTSSPSGVNSQVPPVHPIRQEPSEVRQKPPQAPPKSPSGGSDKNVGKSLMLERVKNAKLEQAADLRFKHASDVADGVHWNSVAARTEYQKLLGEIKGLTAQIANLDI